MSTVMIVAATLFAVVFIAMVIATIYNFITANHHTAAINDLWANVDRNIAEVRMDMTEGSRLLNERVDQTSSYIDKRIDEVYSKIAKPVRKTKASE